MSSRDHRATIVQLQLQGLNACAIIKALKLHRNQRATVYRVLKKYAATSTIEHKSKGVSHKSTLRKKVAKNLRDKIRRNPLRSQRKLAVEHGMSQPTIHRILHEDLHLTAYKCRRKKLYAAGGQVVRLQRAKLLKERLAPYDPNCVIFSDEKIFVIEQQFHPQNRRIYSQSIQICDPTKLYVGRSQKPMGVMVFAAISGNGVCSLKFIDPGCKVNQHYYREAILEQTVLPWAQRTFHNQNWIFQQDGATSHTAKTTQAFCRQHFCDFLAKDEWPAASPDLNPCDFFLWGWLQQLVNCKPHSTISHLRHSIEVAWAQLDQKVVESACVVEFQRRLNLLIRQKGGPIDHLL
jgi:inhibitor of nuclear factor kappa-B kinase subunit alpha